MFPTLQPRGYLLLVSRSRTRDKYPRSREHLGPTPLLFLTTTFPAAHSLRLTLHRAMSAEQPTPAPAPAVPAKEEATPSPTNPSAGTTAEKKIPATQKTWRVTRKGKPADVLKLTDAPVPAKLKKGEVLLKVQAAALNPV